MRDEECIRPGDPTPETLLAKFDSHFGNHAHYLSRQTSRSDKTLTPRDFRLKHYAGDVSAPAACACPSRVHEQLIQVVGRCGPHIAAYVI